MLKVRDHNQMWISVLNVVIKALQQNCDYFKSGRRYPLNHIFLLKKRSIKIRKGTRKGRVVFQSFYFNVLAS